MFGEFIFCTLVVVACLVILFIMVQEEKKRCKERERAFWRNLEALFKKYHY